MANFDTWSAKDTQVLRRQFIGHDADFPQALQWARKALHPNGPEMLMLSRGMLRLDWKDTQARFVPQAGSYSQ